MPLKRGVAEDRMEKRVFIWEPWIFIAFGSFHLHRIWGLIDRDHYARFWMGVLESKGLFYFVLMGVLAGLCVLGIATFARCWGNNYWWRWIYLFGGAYVLFDLYAIAAGVRSWKRLLLWMFDVDSVYWNAVWSFFVLLGGWLFLLGLRLLTQKKG